MEVKNMKFSEEKKKGMILYLLEKIEKNAESLTKSVSDELGVNQNTIYTYINELIDENIIRKVKRGQYELIDKMFVKNLKRSNGDLDSDIYVYNSFFKDIMKDLPKNVQDIWEYTFSEMINNVMDHSNAEDAQVVVLRNYLKTTVVIYDDGIGIFEKIKNYFNMSSLDDAICELFKGKLTTDAKNHSGEGIFFSSKIMDMFMILSDNKIFANNKYDNGGTYEFAEHKSRGTCVIMELSNFTHKQVRQVFDEYSDVEGGFKKTIIPLKNIFDTSPVSRSQARRVCNRLSEFEEVILDFNSLEWMGQGFAHQVFVVFQNEHPEIKITPINMNEAINKMYKHVLYEKEK